MPATVRVFVVLGLSVALASGMPATSVPISTFGAFIEAAAAEIVLGATLGLGILLAFGAFTVAGHLLDIQIGFGIAQVFDPVSQRQLPILTSAFNQLAVLVFFLVDGHHALYVFSPPLQLPGMRRERYKPAELNEFCLVSW